MTAPTFTMTPELQAKFEEHKARMDALTMEVMQDVWHRMPFGQEIALSNGETATIKPFFEPRPGDPDATEADRANASFGFDVIGPQGAWHLEFVAYRSGWGGAV